MRELKDWRKRSNQNKLTPEKLMKILSDLYGEDIARETYHNLTGMKPPEAKDDVKNTTP